MLPIGPLMIEHRLIEQLIEILENHVKAASDVKQIDLDLIDRGVQFLRQYADHCHHGKEEDFLFTSLHEKNLVGDHKRILDELEEDHRIARDAVKSLALAREKAVAGDENAYFDVAKQVGKIAALYPPHIEKEDKHFFIPVMEYFNPSELNEMLQKFFEFDQKLLYEHYYTLVHGLADVPVMGMGFEPVPEETPLKNEAVYQCTVCGFIYDPAQGDPEHGIPAGTAFEDLPADWVCPLCGAGKELFAKQEASPPPPADIKPQKTVKEYRSKDLIVYWMPQDCSHAGKCWQGLPSVFDMDKRPWINISSSRPEDIIKTIDKCPTRALQYSLPEGSAVDPNLAKGPGAKDYKADLDKAGKIRVIRDGPLLVEVPVRIIDTDGSIVGEGDRFVLCRCGKTKNAPFCDGSHIPVH